MNALERGQQFGHYLIELTKVLDIGRTAYKSLLPPMSETLYISDTFSYKLKFS